MESRLVLRTITLLTVWTSVNPKKTTEDFSCCDLPIKIHVNRSHVNEFYINHKTMAIATQSTMTATSPFAVIGNDTLSMDKCEGFVQKIVVEDEYGFIKEEFIHRHSLPCNTLPVVAIIVIGVLLAVGGGIGIIVYLFKKTCANSVV